MVTPTRGSILTSVCAWVAPVTFVNGGSAVLKLGMPHMESEHEIEGLRFRGGDPANGTASVPTSVAMLAHQRPLLVPEGGVKATGSIQSLNDFALIDSHCRR